MDIPMNDLEKKFDEHTEEDRKNFEKIHDTMDCMNKKLDKIGESMENLQGMTDFFKGTKLLQKPLMIIVAFIVGIVALIGGLRTLISWLIIK